jgi:hypothetical protein
MDFAALVAQMDRAVLGLGGTVRYAPRFGEAVDVTGVFDAAYVRADAGQAGVSSSTPAVFLRLDDLPADPADDEPKITVGGVTYAVSEVRKDSQGGVVLFLHRVD